MGFNGHALSSLFDANSSPQTGSVCSGFALDCRPYNEERTMTDPDIRLTELTHGGG